ncbi:MAG: helix-turn-helix domain-containing protein [Clostridiales bacterium]|nr:helix-turn-helix domain-containing protein [Clostridiales bacterium]
MNEKEVGSNIASYRKAKGLTQSELAEKLGVTNKAVSKWESGQCFPDVTFFPIMSSLFGVSVEDIMMGKRKSIAIGGSMLIDVIKSINLYPKQGMLARIDNIEKAVGGCAPNTAINLAKIDRSIPITVYGKVGDDENGKYLVHKMSNYGINTDKIAISKTEYTSFTDVMSLPSGERTFFHKRGANAEFSPQDVDVNALNCEHFHLGYIMLLDEFDKKDKEYGTVMARFLASLKERGIKTSVDMVSDSNVSYKEMVVPSLKYTSYLIVNELEICGIWGLSARTENGRIDTENVIRAMENCAKAGVSDKVIAHAKECCFVYDVKTKTTTKLASLDIPNSEIKGSVGAGDAFCAGCLYALYNNFSDEELLRFASCSASCNLFAENSVDGMKSKYEIMDMEKIYKRKDNIF